MEISVTLDLMYKMKREIEQNIAIINRYNMLRNNIDNRELLDSLLEVPPSISFYIIPLKYAMLTDDIEKIRDYLIWYKYFAYFPIENKFISNLKEEYYLAMYEKYEAHDEKQKEKYMKKTRKIEKEMWKYYRE